MQTKRCFHVFLNTPRSVSKHTSSGFSIIELIVAIGIFIIISSSVLFSYTGFNNRVGLETMAHQIGQWVRDAQVSAMGVRYARTGDTYPGFGLHFDILQPNKFIYFADLDGDNTYLPFDTLIGEKCGDVGVECEREILLTQGARITSLCGQGAVGSIGTTDCTGPYGASSVFDIVFTRPDPDASINGNLNGVSFPTEYSSARMIIRSPKGMERQVEVWITGQISVQ